MSSSEYKSQMDSYKKEMEDIATKRKNKMADLVDAKDKLKKLKAYLKDVTSLDSHLTNLKPIFNKASTYIDHIIVGSNSYDDGYLKNSYESMKTSKTSCSELKQEVAQEISRLKTKIANLKNEIAQLKTDYNTAKSNYDDASDNYDDALESESKQQTTQSTPSTPAPKATAPSSQTPVNTGGSGNSGSSTPSTPASVPKRPTCFLKGTKVLTIDGYKDIEKIQKDDIVLSFDENNNENVYKEVINLIIHKDYDEKLITLEIDNYKLDVTEAHRFYIHGEWIEAGKLKINDEVMYSDKSFHKIKSIKTRQHKDTYYNLEVKDNHNYYVSDRGVLVHNNKALIA